MKKLMFVLALCLAGLRSFGQGYLDFGNNFTSVFNMPIFNYDPGNPFQSQFGIPSTTRVAGVFPTSGTVNYGGTLLQGTGFTLQLWAGSTSADLHPLFTTTFRTATADILPAGLIRGVTAVSIPGVDAGQPAWYQVRAWNNNNGLVTSWDQALNVLADRGSSAIVQSGPLGGIDSTGGVHATSPNSTDWVSFSLIHIPEPSTFGFVGLAACVLFTGLRRK